MPELEDPPQLESFSAILDIFNAAVDIVADAMISSILSEQGN